LKIPPGITNALKALGIMDEKGGIGKSAIPLLGLAASAYQQNKLGSTLGRDLKAAGARSGGAADTLLSQGLAGQAPAAVIAQANQTFQDGVERIKQQYANMGRDPRTDTGALAAISKLQNQRDAQIQQYSQTLTSQGLAAANIAQSPATAAAMAAAQQDQALAASQANVLKQIGQIQAATPGG
jgi:hypothetical protein